MQDDAFYRALLDNIYDGAYFVDHTRRITYWNRGAERITGYAASEVVGKKCSDNVLVHVSKDGQRLCTEICPLHEEAVVSDDRSREVFFHHRSGFRVPVTIRVAPIRDERGAVVGGVEVFTDNTPAAVALERIAELERLAYVDTLTGLANRRYVEITLNARLEELQRYGWRFGVLFIDIDRFKEVNDQHGHDFGDGVLKMVGRTLQNSVRPFDVVSRWGGEEYVVVIANVEGDDLMTAANRSRVLVEQSGMPDNGGLRVTISLGATLASADDTIDSLIRRADRLMYRSKESGRNRVTTDS